MANTAVDASALKQIQDYLETISTEIADLIVSKKMYASGKTTDSLEVVMSNTGGSLMALASIIYLETGRGPTSPTGPYMADPDGLSLLDHITAWIDAKGLDLNPYAVTKTIHKEGTKLYKAGGKSGVLSIPLQLAGLDTLYSNIAVFYAQKTTSEIYELLKV